MSGGGQLKCLRTDWLNSAVTGHTHVQVGCNFTQDGKRGF